MLLNRPTAQEEINMSDENRTVSVTIKFTPSEAARITRAGHAVLDEGDEYNRSKFIAMAVLEKVETIESKYRRLKDIFDQSDMSDKGIQGVTDLWNRGAA